MEQRTYPSIARSLTHIHTLDASVSQVGIATQCHDHGFLHWWTSWSIGSARRIAFDCANRDDRHHDSDVFGTQHVVVQTVRCCVLAWLGGWLIPRTLTFVVVSH